MEQRHEQRGQRELEENSVFLRPGSFSRRSSLTVWRRFALCRRLPLLLIAGTSAGLFVAFLYHSYAIAALAATPTPLLPSPPSSTAVDGADDVDVGDGAHAGDRSFVLHPERHAFRDATVIRLTWTVTRKIIAPDGVNMSVYLINGQFPGPTVEARSGDVLIVNVHNSIDDHAPGDGISIHWHGLSLRGANEMDGVVGLTQCPIRPSANFTYQFRIGEDESGTFWYHAHSGVARADGLFGGLVVHKPVGKDHGTSDLSKYDYQAEQLLLVGDWYHRQATALLEWFDTPVHFGLEPVPDSILINGRGSYNCSKAVPAFPVECRAVKRPITTFPDADRVRLRVINTGASAGFTISISTGLMKVITVDGGSPVLKDSPLAPTIGVLYPGERIDVVADRSLTPINDDATIPAKLPEMTIALDQELMRLYNYALESVHSFPVSWGDAHQERGAMTSSRGMRSDTADDSPVVSTFNLAHLLGATVDEATGAALSAKAGETCVLYTKMSIRSSFHERPVGQVNHSAWVLADPSWPPLLALDRADWGNVTVQPNTIAELQVPWYRDSANTKWMELVINNMDDKGHPFHLHGYSFYVLSTGHTRRGYFGAYNPFDPGELVAMDTSTPLRKDTVYIPSTGYVVLRFPMDNDGLWLLHCHVLWHHAVGMGMVIHVGDAVAPSLQKAASALCIS